MSLLKVQVSNDVEDMRSVLISLSEQPLFQGRQNGYKIYTVPWILDCSQSPYFSEGFSRPVRSDGTAAILVYKSERDLGRVSKLPRGAGVGGSIVGGSAPLPSVV